MTNYGEILSEETKDFIQCNLCNQNLNTEAGLKKHKLIAHGVKNPNKCIRCDFISKGFSQLDKHYATNGFKNEGVKKCPRCPYTVQNLLIVWKI